MEDFKKFSLLKDVQTITSDGTPSMDKQDKTAIDFLKENVEMLAMESYAQHRTAELEAKIKELEASEDELCKKIEAEQKETLRVYNFFEAKIKVLEYDLLDALDLKEGKGPTALSMLSSRVKALKERLEAADEVIQASRSIKLYATHGLIAEDYNKALEKYNSLKQ